MSLQPYRDTNSLLSNVPLPDLVLLRQRFERPRVSQIQKAVVAALDNGHMEEKIHPGDRIAIAVGSRGIAEIAPIIRSLVTVFRHYGADPFIVPAMGSHGGATPEGQRQVLSSLGVTEESVAAPIISSLEVDLLGSLPNGMPVYIDRRARAADGIFVVNRIKPHTDFSASIESGLAKMIAIGLSKHAGALTLHSWGLKGLTTHISEAAQFTMARTSILGGLAILENAYDEVADIVLLSPPEIGRERENILLKRARNMMPRLPWDSLDVLIVDEIGKNISGSGMDTNIVGRMRWGEQKPTATDITSIALLDITAASHGNGIGLGLADFTTARVLKKLDSQSLYINTITAGVIAINSGKIPIVLETDREAVAAAIRASGRADWSQVFLARIQNTLKLEYILASPASISRLRPSSDIEILGVPRHFALTSDDSLVPFNVLKDFYMQDNGR